MSPVDLERLRQGGPDCPSEVMLHRLRAGELAEAQARTIQAHVNGCERCQALVAQHAVGFSAWPEADPVRMLAAIRRGAEERAARSAAGWRARLRAAFAPLALVGTAAVVAVVAVLATGSPPDPGPETRLKGGPVLHVFRRVAAVAEVVEVRDGEEVAPGESIQLTMDLPADGVAQVAGVDPSGTLYSIWPKGGAPFASMKAGAGQRVPGAFALDDATGAETVHLVFCPASVVSPSCRSQGVGAPLACSPGCTSTLFTLRRDR